MTPELWGVIISGSILLTVIILFNLFLNLVQVIWFARRMDFSKGFKYFTAEDFGLEKETFVFDSLSKIKVNGYIYRIKLETYKGIVVLAHGMGPGHLAYTTEINYFAQNGFIVYAYDIPGTGNSTNKHIGSMEEAIATLEGLLEYLKNETLKVSLYGHSWGGYAVLNVNKKYHLHAVAALAPVRNFFYGVVGSKSILNFVYVPFITLFKYAKYYKIDTVKTISKTRTKTAIFYSRNDPSVRFLDNINPFYKLNNHLISLIERNKPTHRINLSDEGLKYDNKFNEDLRTIKDEKTREEYLKNVDWSLMTELDENLMSKILRFYE
ncbi:MAG: alpha/beta fold hydrolase [Bacillales bacterium]|jgi:pimeloyl-ACP methyl ester carboxylesterase|nr:alpha/beta fold hydrolase [Bacillales bacterium]